MRRERQIPRLIHNARGQIAGFERQIREMQRRIGQHLGAIDLLRQRRDEREQELRGLGSSRRRASVNRGNFVPKAPRMRELQTTIAEYDFFIAQNQQEIADLQNAMAGLAERIRRLEQRIVELRR